MGVLVSLPLMPITPLDQDGNSDVAVKMWFKPWSLWEDYSIHTLSECDLISIHTNILVIQRMVHGLVYQHHVRACYKCRISGPIPDLLTQNLHIIEYPIWFVCALKCGKHTGQTSIFIFTPLHFSLYWSAWIPRLLSSLRMRNLFYLSVYPHMHSSGLIPPQKIFSELLEKEWFLQSPKKHFFSQFISESLLGLWWRKCYSSSSAICRFSSSGSTQHHEANKADSN